MQIDLTEDLEQELRQIAQDSGKTPASWLAEIIRGLLAHQDMLEDLQDILEAERIRKAIDRGEEELIEWETVKHEMGL